MRRVGSQLTGDGRLEVRAVKLFADGALGSRGAALLDDYSDQPGWKGLLLQPEETLPARLVCITPGEV